MEWEEEERESRYRRDRRKGKESMDSRAVTEGEGNKGGREECLYKEEDRRYWRRQG